MTKNTINNQKYIDDEIDLMPYIKHVISHGRWFLYSGIVAIFIAALLSLILPKKYKASTTFFLPESTVDVGSAGSILGVFGVSMLNSGTSGIYSTYVMPIFNSRRIKQYVATQFLDHPTFVNDPNFQDIEENKKINYIIGAFNFSENIKLEIKEGMYVISFQHAKPDVLLPVLDAYLDALIQLNEELNIDSDALQIIPLDEAVTPTGAFYPNLKKLLIISISLSLFVVLICSIIDKIWLNLGGVGNKLNRVS